MSNLPPHSPASASVPRPPSALPLGSAGVLLRQARQAQGLHIEALAASLKISVAKLEALEADNLAVFPDNHFVRALAASVCRALKVDATPVLAALPTVAQPRLAQNSEGINTQLRDARSRSLFTLFGGKLVTLAVFVLLLGALLLFFLPERPEPEPSTIENETPTAQALPAPASVPEETAPPPLLSKTPEVVSAPSTEPAPATVPGGVINTSPPVPAPATAPAPVENQSLQKIPDSSAIAENTLVLSARAPSWIHVRNTKGTTVLQRMLTAGESVTVAHPPPLSVTVGRADMTDVYVRGARFEIAALSRDNVAKFEVK